MAREGSSEENPRCYQMRKWLVVCAIRKSDGRPESDSKGKEVPLGGRRRFKESALLQGHEGHGDSCAKLGHLLGPTQKGF